MESLFYIVLSVVFFAFFTGLEISFLSATRWSEDMDDLEKQASNRLTRYFRHHSRQFLSTLLLGSALSLVVYVFLSYAVFRDLLWTVSLSPVWCSFLCALILSLVLMLFAEFFPKPFFKVYADGVSRVMSIPAGLVYFLFYPFSRLLAMLSSYILKVKGVKESGMMVSALGKIDLDHFIQKHLEQASENPELDTEVKIFQNALDFSKVKLRDCAVPRTEVVACDLKTPLDKLRLRFVETGLSKILVFDGEIDRVVGYIHSSELFKDPEDWTLHIRKMPIVPETMSANKLMKLLMREKKSMAVVVDEFGGVSGIVTLEDLVEEIFGEIEDEHDMNSCVARRISDHDFLVSGRMEIDVLNEKFGLDLPESEEYVTVAGYILHAYQKFPQMNESIRIGKFVFRMVKISATKIELVRLKIEEN